MTYKTLASMDFNGMLFEAQAQTKTGQELLNKYQSYVMANPVTCGVVNNFLKEAAQLSYDNGINSVLDKVSKVVIFHCSIRIRKSLFSRGSLSRSETEKEYFFRAKTDAGKRASSRRSFAMRDIETIQLRRTIAGLPRI